MVVTKLIPASVCCVAAGLTERQALALALEESRRAAQVAERAQLQDNSSDGSSGSEDESRAGTRARKGGKDSMAKRKRQPAGAKSTGDVFFSFFSRMSAKCLPRAKLA